MRNMPGPSLQIQIIPLKKKNFIYLILAVLGLHCCSGFSLVVVSRGLLSIAVCRLIAVASLVAGHRL